MPPLHGIATEEFTLHEKPPPLLRPVAPGLSVVESMAVPVIAWNRGSMPDLLDDGVHGFVVHSMDEAAVAVEKVGELPRGPLRQHVVKRFSREQMVDDYIKVYERMLGRR